MAVDQIYTQVLLSGFKIILQHKIKRAIGTVYSVEIIGGFNNNKKKNDTWKNKMHSPTSQIIPKTLVVVLELARPIIDNWTFKRVTGPAAPKVIYFAL